MATVVGNICQRPRCWYYRHPEFPCLRKGGDRCYAANGENRYHAILGGGPCHIVCPSDLAPALMSLNARLEIASPDGRRETAIGDFFVGPRDDPHRENVLEPNELITTVIVPQPAVGSRGIFEKARERKAFDFALASVSAVVTVSDSTITAASVVLGGVAPNPWRSAEAEETLVGARIDDRLPMRAADAAIASARPLRDNGYKVTLTRNLVAGALSRLFDASGNDSRP